MVRASTSLGLIKPSVGPNLYSKNNAEGADINKPNGQDSHFAS